LATTCRWFSAARLAIAFAEIGSLVEMVGPRGHPATKTTALSHRYSFRGLAPADSFRAAIDQAKPDLIVCCDDSATVQLHRLYAVLRQEGKADSRAGEVLRRSLGPESGFATLESRSKLMALARSLGVRTPETSVVTRETLGPWLMQNGFPAVLKADGSAGGLGVQVVRTMAMAEQAFADLSAPPLVLRAVKRAMFDQDRTLIKPCLQRFSPVVNAQAMVSGRDATFSVSCWEGEVLASISLEVVKKQMQDGPSSVVRVIDHPEMAQAGEKIVRHLGLSGFFGFDFILGESNRATLIEMNARATQVCHLALGTRRNLPLALASAAGGEPIPASQPVSNQETIVLFPQEWHSNPASKYIATGFHDVPWQEPRLVESCVQFYTGQKKWYSSRHLVNLYKRHRLRSSAPARSSHPVRPETAMNIDN
jgi:formate-dependent phosphoribosylglycinamide formyltransferase (GAR transformylase)